MNIQWYPGHMTKAKRMMEENIKLIDCVVELLDARTPLSSQNPELPRIAGAKPRLILMTKMDLADPSETEAWVAYFKEQGILAMPVNSRDGQNMNKVVPLIHEACKERIERNRNRGLINKPLRIMVAGIPNVGKSTFINKLVGKASAKTGNKPGVTKGKQWINIKKGLELLDTPGILWPKFEDKTVGYHLAFIGSIKDDILDVNALTRKLLEHLILTYPKALVQSFPCVEPYLANDVLSQAKNNEQEMDRLTHQLLSEITLSRNLLKEGNKPDFDRMSKLFLDEFRAGKYGRITIDLVRERRKL
ncbi:MAG: ribosome biogenesis GTPase YlqF [Vallitaleaceae bacterium]|nr:ribosome biogenesis GTPase YlqF [Vallitaleaceae bacterium]